MLAARADDGRFDPFAGRRRHRSWRVAEDAAADFGERRQDPAAFVGNVDTVPRPERGDAPHRRPERAHERRLRGGLQRGQGARLAGEHEPHRRPDGSRDLWQDSGISIWNRVFRALAESEQLDGVESARLLAMTNLAGADGSIGCWNDKYYWNFWRPITAIREAG